MHTTDTATATTTKTAFTGQPSRSATTTTQPPGPPRATEVEHVAIIRNRGTGDVGGIKLTAWIDLEASGGSAMTSIEFLGGFEPSHSYHWLAIDGLLDGYSTFACNLTDPEATPLFVPVSMPERAKRIEEAMQWNTLRLAESFCAEMRRGQRLDTVSRLFQRLLVSPGQPSDDPADPSNFILHATSRKAARFLRLKHNSAEEEEGLQPIAVSEEDLTLMLMDHMEAAYRDAVRGRKPASELTQSTVERACALAYERWLAAATRQGREH